MIKPNNAKNTEKSFENLIFIDFQFTLWSSPTIDLHHFLNTALSDELRPSYFDDLVKFYHEQLVGYLGRLNFGKEIPT